MSFSRMKKFALPMLIAAVVTYAQQPPAGKSKSDAEKITSALRAGPEFVTRNAAVVDWPTSPGGEYRVIRAGTNGWTCLPGLPQAPHDEPGCFDQVFLQFLKDSLAGRTPDVQKLGISFMYGPHVMIIGPDQHMLEAMSRDGSTGEPYVNHLPGRTELYLVIPMREWDDSAQR